MTPANGFTMMTVIVADNDRRDRPTGIAHAHIDWHGAPHESPFPYLLCRANEGTTTVGRTDPLNLWATEPGTSRCEACLDYLVP